MNIIFLGNMNNLPFSVAKAFKKKSYNVTQLIDVKKEFLLDRPESEDASLINNYPDWIIDLNYVSTEYRKILLLLFANIFYRKLIRMLNEFDVIVLNGVWLRLGKYIEPSKVVIGIFAGSELDNIDDSEIDEAISRYERIKKYKFIPNWFIQYFLKKNIELQKTGIRRTNIVNYYLPGVNPIGDNMLYKIKFGQNYSQLLLRGFDTSLYEYSNPTNDNEFTILCACRFFYADMSRADNKRNDIMLAGIKMFIENNKIESNLKLIFYEKGADLEKAKQYTRHNNIDRFVEWRQVTSIINLKNSFKECHVAFDQLGTQWPGVGLFSMLVGRPLICNERPDLIKPVLQCESPVCQSTNEYDVCNWLTLLYNNRDLVVEIGKDSRKYVLDNYSVDKNCDFYINEIEKFYKNER